MVFLPFVSVVLRQDERFALADLRNEDFRLSPNNPKSSIGPVAVAEKHKIKHDYDCKYMIVKANLQYNIIISLFTSFYPENL